MMMLTDKRASPVPRMLLGSRYWAGEFGMVSSEVVLVGATAQSWPSSGKQVSPSPSVTP